ncbi:unnamed protein product [Meloidogyne enterolobii]|uniref:Uncharacterized protein n=1 Tax=Meloidogyne enterolobii TaxID=390850 RepID=A0ACB0YFX5_MELEN
MMEFEWFSAASPKTVISRCILFPFLLNLNYFLTIFPAFPFNTPTPFNLFSFKNF